MRETLEAIHDYPWEFFGLALAIVCIVGSFSGIITIVRRSK